MFLVMIFSSLMHICIGREVINATFTVQHSMANRVCPVEGVPVKGTIACVVLCGVEGSSCTGLTYDESNNLCYLCENFVLELSEPLVGTVSYKRDGWNSVCDEEQNLVTGICGVPDANIQASSEYDTYYANQSRFNSNSSWVPANNTNAWIQVRFMEPKVVTTVLTTGHGQCCSITSYQIHISHDCDVFEPILENSTYAKEFPAYPEDGYGEVENNMDHSCLCLRLLPTEWMGQQEDNFYVNFEVKGHRFETYDK